MVLAEVREINKIEREKILFCEKIKPMTSLTSLAAESEVQALRFALRFSPPTLVLEYKRGSDGKKRVSKFQLRKLKSSSVSDGGVGWDCLLFETAILAAYCTVSLLLLPSCAGTRAFVEACDCVRMQAL